MKRYLTGIRWFGFVLLLRVLMSGSPALAQAPQPEVENALWVADSGGALQVATVDGRLRLAVEGLGPVLAVAVDEPRGTVWAYTKSTLHAFDLQGESRLEIPVDLPDSEHVELAVDRRAEAVWLAVERSVLVFAVTGEPLASFELDDTVRGLLADPARERVWLATGSSLTARQPVTGASLLDLALPDLGEVVDLDIDPESGEVWVLLEKALALFDSQGALRFTSDLTGGSRVARDGGGGAWVAMGSELLHSDPSGATTAVAEPFAAGVEIRHLVSDPADGSPWVTSDTEIVHLDGGGRVLLEFAFEPPVHISALAVEDRTPPQLAILAPAQGSHLSQSAPELRLAYGDIASAVDSSSLLLARNGEDWPMECEASAEGATCALLAPLPDGEAALAVTVADFAGNQVTAVVAFSVGTSPPSLPPDPATVAPPVDPTVATDIASATEFLYSGPSPIQTGVASAAIEARRVAVIRGRVLARDGSPLPGVTITVPAHSELGFTRSREDGLFDLVVNGGGSVLLRYERSGYLTAQRHVETPWRDYVWAEDVVLVPLDAEATVIATGAGALQLARGSAVTDEDGTRRATLLFPAGTQAELALPDGSHQALSSLTVRATEYTVGPRGPQAMPAPLPPSSGYTYAMELSADEALAAGATRMTFSQPVPFYVENFLDFPVGGVVPVGYYDRQKAAWIPSENGRVIAVLSVTGELADLDLDGSGTAADAAALAALGITDDERRQLATLYAPGQSLWRVPIPHFTPWDCNWPYGPPDDAEEPPDPEEAKDDEGDEDDDCTQSGSVIECTNQILGESVAVVGTPFRLHYQSDRVPGRKTIVEVVLSGAQVPASLKRIELQIDLAGRRFLQTFPPAPNQTYNFLWDGKDAYGRTVQGKQFARVQVGYVYPGIYYGPAAFRASFGVYSPSTTVVSSSVRGEITFWRAHQRAVGAWDARAQGLGGWTLSPHHAYDPNHRTLWLGDGTRRTIDGPNTQGVSTVAGGLSLGQDVKIGPDGSVYFLERRDSSAWWLTRIKPDGTKESRFLLSNTFDPSPTGFDLGPAGTVYYSICGTSSLGTRKAEVRRLEPSGAVQVVVPSSAVTCPEDVAVAGDGTVLVADSEGNRILSLGRDDQVIAIAGGGTLSGEGVPALLAQLSPRRLALARDGAIYFVASGRFRVRRIGPDGIVTTVAGGGDFLPFDGASATTVSLFPIERIAVHPNGSLLLAAGGQKGSFYRVSPSGILSRLAGAKTGVLGDDAPALATQFFFPESLAVHPDGSVYVSDFASVRRIILPLPGFREEAFFIASEDGRSAFGFDYRGRHVETTDALTGATLYTFDYDASGRLLEVHDVSGNATRIERDAAGVVTAIVAPFGQRTRLTVGADGWLRAIEDPAGERWAVGTTQEGLLTSFTNPRSFTARYSYSATGRLATAEGAAGGSKGLSRTSSARSYRVDVTSALGRSTAYGIEQAPNSKKRTVTAPSGLTSQATLGSDGTVVARDPSGAVTTLTTGGDPRFGLQAPFARSHELRMPSGLTFRSSRTRTATLATLSDPFSLRTLDETFTTNGRVARRTYDATQRSFSLTSAAGRRSSATLDALGRPAGAAIEGLAPVTLTYDDRGRLSTLAQGSGDDERAITLSYGADGLLAEVLDPLGRRIRFDHDAVGRVVRQTLPDGRVIDFAYDANGNLTSLTPPVRPSHAFHFTPIDLPEEYAPPPLGESPTATSYSYNLDRQLTRIDRPDGRHLDLSYDTAGRLAAIDFSLGQLAFTYHPTTGNLAAASAPEEALSYNYDGHLLTTTTWSGPVAGSVTRSYDSDFRVASRSVNGADPITFQYDADSLLTRAGGMTLTRSSQNGLLTGTALGQVTTSQTYNAFGELASFTASFSTAPLYAATYTRDKLGRITSKVETISGVTATTDYGYDLAGRLVDVARDGASLAHYEYDGNGNRAASTGPSGVVTASYDAQDRLLSYGDTTYAYTANGELRSKTQNGQTVSYDYDELGNLRQVILPDGITIDYVIDGQNRRAGKKINGVLVQGFLYHDPLNPVAELDGAGAVVARFVYGSRPNVPDYLVKGGATYRIVADHLGSPRLIVNTATGDIAQRLDFDEFGRVTLDTNPGFQPFGFAGGLYDRQTRLVRFGARDYDPEVGRWTAKDPAGFAANDPNLYRYAIADPVNRKDPNGRDAGALAAGWAIAAGEPTPIGEVIMGVATVGAGLWWLWNYFDDATEPPVVGPADVPDDAVPGDSCPKAPPYPGNDPTQPPGPDWVWKGRPGSRPGDPEGSWHNPKEGSLRPDLEHGGPHGPHWDWKDPSGKSWRLNPDGSVTPKGGR